MDRIRGRRRKAYRSESEEMKKGLKKAFFDMLLKVLGETIKDRLIRLLAATAVTAAVTQTPVDPAPPPPSPPTTTKTETPPPST